MSRSLLLGGVVAGPIYLLVSGIQGVTREGFDMTRHPASLLSNGDFGWIQILNFVVTGALVIAAAVGMRRAMRSGSASMWGPILIGVFGAGLIASGIFVADPADGFPPGTPAGDPESVSFSGVMHFMVSGIGFVGLVAACVLFARRFLAESQTAMGIFSLITGVYYLVAFGIVATGGGSSTSIVIFTIAVVLGWAWLTLVTGRYYSESYEYDSYASKSPAI